VPYSSSPAVDPFSFPKRGRPELHAGTRASDYNATRSGEDGYWLYAMRHDAFYFSSCGF
jgi:hypothetical protein